MCQMSHDTCHMSSVTFFLDKVVELICWGSVINKAYPVYFSFIENHYICGGQSFDLIFKASALWANAFYKSKYPSVCLCVCLSVCVCVCLFTFEVPFNGFFAPTSQSRMSNIFRDSEFLGKSNGKKWSQIWTFLFENCLKSLRKKKFFFSHFFHFWGTV